MAHFDSHPLDLAMSEKDFQTQVIELAEAFGWRVYHTRDSRRSPGGFPDLVLLRSADEHRSGLLFVELKTETGKVTAEQAIWLKEIDELYAVPEAFLWRPRDWDRIVEVLR